jgi:outer membrane biosynthesis protein TonB
MGLAKVTSKFGSKDQSKDASGKFVLENSEGFVVRTFEWKSSNLFLIYRHDSRRVEVVSDLRPLEDDKISFDVIKSFSSDAVKKRAIKLPNGATLRFSKEVGEGLASIESPEESEEQEKAIYKWTALTQISAMLFILIVGLLIEPFFSKKPDEILVVVAPQQIIQKKETITVKATDHKIEQNKKVANHKVVSKVKEVPKTLTAKVKTVRKENATLRTKVNVEKVGALGVLGGMKSGSKNSAGFNMSATNDSLGSSFSGVGSGGAGGVERAIPGKGLVAGTPGSGGKVTGGGGYSTRGKAGGGRAGYGDMGIGGTAASYFQPMEEEALVEGGLDRDQIAAVINRHIGEVIYCYERGLQVSPGLAGRVNERFVINGSGHISSASVASSSLKNASVESCITSHLKSWQFPKPVGGVNVKVTYPFMLKRLSQG